MEATHYTVMMEQADLTTRCRTVATLAHARTIARRWRKAGRCIYGGTVDVVRSDANGCIPGWGAEGWAPVASY
jgi:hypothetical protein